jgi:hypothetical protein
MRIGVLGTGAAGRALAARFAELGHEVTLGTREVKVTRAKEESWYAGHPQVRLVTQAEAAAHAEMVANACSGEGSLAALGNARAASVASGPLRELGWADTFDLGDLGNARGQEMWMGLRTRLDGRIGHVHFNIKLVR